MLAPEIVWESPHEDRWENEFCLSDFPVTEDGYAVLSVHIEPIVAPDGRVFAAVCRHVWEPEGTHWMVTVPAVLGFNGWGKDLPEAREEARDWLADSLSYWPECTLPPEKREEAVARELAEARAHMRGQANDDGPC